MTPKSHELLYHPAMHLPYLIADFKGIGGVIKQRPEDFFVQEIPLYEPSGEGEHVYTEIQKVGITTFEVLNRLSRMLNVAPANIGYAGMKDAHAVTRQVFSIAGTTPEAVMAVAQRDTQLGVQWATRHGNKLRIGHLRGNRFAIKIRDVDPIAVVKIKPVLDALQQRGMPNYFGEQRFGRRGDNHLLGAALVRNDNAAILKLLLGSPNLHLDDSERYKARVAFEARDNEAALKFWPRNSGVERRVLSRLMSSRRPNAAVRVIDVKVRRLWVSAVQSHLFNQILARRVTSLGVDKVVVGDMAEKHDNGACFYVEDLAAEQPRCERFEISPTGPLVGYRVNLAKDTAGAIEEAVLNDAGMKPDDFRHAGRHKVKGGRRALRVRPTDVSLESGVDDDGAYITVAFTLPAGAFATVLMREIMRDDEVEAEPDGEPSNESDSEDDSIDVSEEPESTDDLEE